MEAALVTVSMGVMKPLLSKLSKLLQEEHAKIKGVGREAKFLRDEMSTMSATLQMLSDAEELNPQMKDWRDTVRELSYDMEDCVDDFMARAYHDHDVPVGVMGLFFSKLKKLKPRHEIGGEIKELKTRAMDASERHKRYKMNKSTPGSGSCVTDPRLHALYVEVGKLVGIDIPKEHIIEWFKREDSSSQLKVVTVVGPAGLGKTTLANQVYHTIRSQYRCTAFVSVSRKPNMKYTLREIAKELGITENTADDDVKQLIDSLRKHLQDEKYLVVIDDVWNEEAWKIIRLALMNNDKGSRIITTTRNTVVASCSSSQGDYIYGMEPLSTVDSKRLFFNRVFGSEDLCYPHLKKVSDGILKKCAGLPLAIITLSGLLADQNAEGEWNRVLAAIGSALEKDPHAENMTKILSFSYFDLPHHLRSALLYLSMFPEDHIIKKQLLIGRWIAEGFIHEEPGRSAYEVGEVYFNDLINRSLIQPVDVEYGQVNACRVHDIILDFITCKAAEENFVTSFTSFDASEHGYVPDYRVRRLCVEDHKIEHVTKLTTPVLSHVRSLTIFGNFMQISLSDFPALRVLDLGECSELENHHLANIEKLFLLKYLRLRLTSTGVIPRKIGKLKYLETLDLRGVEITELPSTITRLQRLSRLYVIQGTRFPRGMIGKLKSLEELEEFGVFSGEQGESLQEFSQLTKLRTLKVAWGIIWSPDSAEGRKQSDLQSNIAALVSSCNIHHLHIFSTHTPAPRRVLSLELWCLTTPL
ncbi:hypothetical protein ACQ4PT_014472 [Festuca glaucescens]